MQVILGTKIGMTQIIGEDGVVTPVTILQVGFRPRQKGW